MSEREASAKGSMRGRLLRGVALLALMLVAVAALGAAALTRLGGAIGLILRENYVSVIACEEMSEALERQDSAAQFSASGRPDVGLPMLAKHRPAFDAAFKKEAANITLPGEGELVAEVDRRYRDYIQAVDRVLGSPPEARSAAYFGELLPKFSALKGKVVEIRNLNQKNMEWADGEARRLARRTLQAALLVTAAALVLATWLGTRIPKTVLDPIAALTERARAIGEGRFDATLPLPELSELRTLAEAMNRMQDRLRAYRESSLGELLSAKDLSRATLAAMTDPVLVFGPRGDVLLANGAAESTFGLRAGDGAELSAHPAEVPDAIGVARDVVLTSGEPHLPQSLADAMRWVTSDGERWFLVRASPLRGDDGQGALVIAQDVTRFRRIDALKSDVVATVSHELKTPLTSLRLSTNMLLEEGTGALNDVQRELAETARDESDRLQRTVDELLDLVRIEREAGELHRATIEPESLLREIAGAHQSLAEQKRVTLKLTCDTSSVIELDPEQIAILLGNLVSNAIRHSHVGGPVTIAARNVDGDLEVTVTDEGEGIAPEHLPKIFERHWRAGEPATLRERHGLGLAIAREIATRHGGTLEAESTLGQGSTFRLRLPRAVVS